jgi:hypothetical protein
MMIAIMTRISLKFKIPIILMMTMTSLKNITKMIIFYMGMFKAISVVS